MTRKHEIKKLAQKHQLKLNALLRKFFQLLDKTPKPSDEEVRNEFLKLEYEWRIYCVDNQLGIRPSLLFNAKVARKWETQYVRVSRE